MHNLPDVTLLSADCATIPGCASPERAIVALEMSRRAITFGAVKLLTSHPTTYQYRQEIRHLGSINDYSAFCLKELHQHVDTRHVLVVQHDGWVLNPSAWDDSWLQYDYIGPLFEQENPPTWESVGSGGFSLRSKRLCRAVSDLLPAWDGSNSYDGQDGKNSWGHEDGVICKHLRYALSSQGLNFAPTEVAARFAFGRNRSLMYPQTSFGFHGYCPETEARGVDSWKVLHASCALKNKPPEIDALALVRSYFPALP